jgi:hypothetical protein
MVSQDVIQLHQNTGALGGRNVGDADVAGEGMAV